MIDENAVQAAVVTTLQGGAFLNHWRVIKDGKDEVGDAGMEVARAKKAAKRDGVNLDALKITEQLAKLDATEREILMLTVEMYCGWLTLPLGRFSAGLTVPEVKQSTRDDFNVWQAGQEGQRAGAGGSLREANPYKPGSAMFVAWDKRWAGGFRTHQKKLAGQMARKGKPTVAATGAPVGGAPRESASNHATH